MSQRRLIASLIAISSCLVLVGVLAAWTFPLKAQGVVGGVIGGVPGGIAQGISGGVAGGVSNGVVEGVISGIPGGINTHAADEEPNVGKSTIWVDKVKRGPMLRQVRGLGTLSRGEGSEKLIVKIAVPAVLATDLRPNQNATIDTHLGLVKGHVTSINPGSSDQSRTINLALDAPLPQVFWLGPGYCPAQVNGTLAKCVDLSVAGNVVEIDATIDIEMLDNVLQVGRPVNGRQNSETSLFKITDTGSEAVRTQVKLGRASVNTIEVLDGLQEGDKVILSDMSAVANAERVRLTQDASQPQTPQQEKPASLPTCRYCPNPDYPDEARKAKISSAKVVLQVSVLESGDVDPQDIRVLKDPGNGFADKAISAVKKWKMKPATLGDGTPVKISVPVEVSFRMKTK